MAHLLVIFGAGASYDSVDPEIAPRMGIIAGLGQPGTHAVDMFRPPLASELFSDRNNFGRVIDRPSLHAARPLITSLRYAVRRGESVEDALGAAMDAARSETHSDVRLLRQIAAVRFYLQESIAECGSRWSALANGITNYGSLLDRIERWRGPANSVSLVTFNYDTMLEEACRDALEWNIASINDYASAMNPPYVLVKPHGSVNWARIGGPLPTSVRTGNPDELIQNMIRDSPTLMFPQAGAHFVSLPEPQPWYLPPESEQSYYAFPALAIPLAEKSQFECPPAHLDVLRDRVHGADRLIVVGWRGVERHFLERYNGHVPHDARVLIIGGSDCDYTPLRDGLGLREEARVHSEGFSAFLRTDALEQFLTP